MGRAPTPRLPRWAGRGVLWVLAIALAWGLVPRDPALADRHHTVRSGQTIAAIARRYRIDVDELLAANRLRRSSTLRPGMNLRVPDRGEIYARPGDTLARLARRHDVSVSELRRLNRLRSGRLRAYQRLILPTYLPPQEEARDWGPPADPGVVTLIRRRGHDEPVQVRLVDEGGRVLRESLPILGSVLRRQDDDPVRDPNPRLALLLARLSDAFGGRPITVVSGWRAARGYTRATSRHTQGRAADIKIQGVGNRTLWETCRRLGGVGCGYYPRSTFVHVDARLARTQWVDWSRPGSRPRYGTLRGPTNARRRRSMSRPRMAGEVALAYSILEPDGTITEVVDEPGSDDEDDNEADASESGEEGEDEAEDDVSPWEDIILPFRRTLREL